MQRVIRANISVKNKMIIEVRVKANAKTDSIKEIKPGSFEMRVKDVPEKGRANLKIIKILSEKLGVSKSRISIKKGASSKVKWFEIL
ncbi:MAG: DUF167 domain-containing protein [Patescibacteria group bacterium]